MPAVRSDRADGPASRTDAVDAVAPRGAASGANRRRRHRSIRSGKVRVTGFEPAAFWTQTRRSTKLSYTLGIRGNGRPPIGSAA